MMTQPNRSNPVVVSAALIVVLAAMMYANAIVTPVLLALFISIICAQPIYWLQKRRVPQWLAIVIVFLMILAVFFGFGELIGSSLSSFSAQAPLMEQRLEEMGGGVMELMADKGFQFPTNEISGMYDSSEIMSLTAGVLGQLGGIMGNAFTIFLLVLFLLMELDSLPIKAQAILKGKTDSLAYISKIGSEIRHYLSIKTITSLLTGVSVWLLLLVIGLDYAILWGLVAFLLNYIPNIGSLIAAVPAVLFALIQLGYGGALGTIGIFVVVNLVVGNFVEPRMMGKGLGLSTFVVFFALIFWGFILGTVGMFLSVPLTIAMKIMLEQNPETRGFALALGTQEEAEALILEQNTSPED